MTKRISLFIYTKGLDYFSACKITKKEVKSEGRIKKNAPQARHNMMEYGLFLHCHVFLSLVDIHALLWRVGEALSAQCVIIRIVETGRLVGSDGENVGGRVASLFPCVAVGSEVGTDVVAEVWWLVVTDILVEYSHVICVVGHELNLNF